MEIKKNDPALNESESPQPRTPIEPQGLCCECRPSWQDRLVEERSQLLYRTIQLKKHMDDPEAKHKRKEWEMLEAQFCFMKQYLQVLTDRCVYYGLIEAGDLGLHY